MMAAAAAAVIAAALSACGPAAGDAPAAGATAGDGGATTLDLLVFNALHADFYQEMATAWNARNPDRGIVLEPRVLPLQEMHNQLQMAFTAGQQIPDIVDIEVMRFPNFTIGTQVLYDLAPYAEPYLDDLVQARLDLYTHGGMLLGLPTHVGATVAFYNVPLLESAGVDWTAIETWDDFRDAGVKLHAETGAHLGSAGTSGGFTHHLLVGQHEADYTDDEGILKLTTPEVVAAFEMLQEMHATGVLGIIPGGTPDSEEGFAAIANGDFGAVIMPVWFGSRFINYMPDLAGQIAVAVPPTLPGSDVVTIGGGGTGTAVPLASEHRELAAEFVAFAKLSEQANVRVWELLGFDPVNTSVWSDEAVTHNPDNRFVQYFYNNPFDALLEMRGSVGLLASQRTHSWPEVIAVMNSEILDSILESGVPAADALERAEAALRNTLRQ
ncbi:ABC transporter substrate-binding protein [Xylanimonas ulmi]